MTIQDKLNAQIAQAEQHNPRLNALISIMAGPARSVAAALDAGDEPRGLLHGMTIAVKDNIDVVGTATTAGASFRRDALPNSDAPVVERLRRAGAVIMGKANMAELAFGIRSRSTVGGQCRNPWAEDRIPGGSSGGSGAAVAAGFCDAALGSDTGGSVRLPAAFCGVSGLRPTSGRVPNRGSVPVSAALDTIGPLARRVEDVALIFAVTAGFDPADPYSVDQPLENFLPHLHDGIAGCRIGIPRNHYFNDCDPDVVTAVMAAAHTLEALGAILVEVDVPEAERVHAATSAAVFADACTIYGERLKNAPETVDLDIRTRMLTGLNVTGMQYAEAMAFKRHWMHTLRGLFGGIDMLLSPTAPVGAPPIEDGASLLNVTRDMTKNTYAGAFGALPGLSVPCGLTSAGLPIGLQLEAAWWAESLLLRAGCAFQGRTDFHRARPSLA
ncbi:amidase [Acidisphaera sp. L21]|uniref:amidase n=1 Tax=Acidisphaera sp. L21 TaxID=1641851 RepID=UPI00131DA41E|nr:amidase [Acidisphaera sp. L21]